MAVNVSSAVSSALLLASQLVSDIEKAVASGGGLAAEGINLVEIALADSAVKASVAALIAAL